jgi:alkaline phosphatase D
MVPSLPVPLPGIYPSGDTPTRDMDSNGWPHNKRNKAVGLLRKGFALHLAGDQHLGSVMQYGIDTYGEGSFAFSGPALNNTWPRRWWPTLAPDHEALPNKPAYTGNFEDGFHNKVTVHAVANPTKTGLEPAIIFDRATGYGMVIFDPANQAITMECWPRSTDPIKNPEAQYPGWPISIKVEDNYGKKALGYLPTIVTEIENPVVQLIKKKGGEVVYTRRFLGNEVKPKIFEEGKYIVKIGESSSSFGKGKVYKFKNY